MKTKLLIPSILSILLISCAYLGGLGGGDIETVDIGDQTWMKKNLNVPHNSGKGNSWCYDDDESNCDEYGRLYDWAAAMDLPSSCNSSSCASRVQAKHRGLCPEGFHVPTGEEWQTLMNFAGHESTCILCGSAFAAGRKLKAQSGWNDYEGSSSNGTDEYGFSALPGGIFIPGTGHYAGFSDVGNNGYWWGASEDAINNPSYDAYFQSLTCRTEGFSCNSVCGSPYNPKSDGYSVRCLKD
jgi:uncharacterized protein (TIGR02145 family)